MESLKETRGQTNEALLLRARDGDKDAEELLISENLPLVRSIAFRFRGRGCEDEDLLQIGTMGLLRAARSFDISRGVVFSTYAVPLIIGEIKRFLRDDGMIKVGRTRKQLGIRLFKEREEYIHINGREPRLSELAEAVGVDMEEAAAALEASSPIKSLSDPVSQGNEGELTVGDTVSAGTEELDRITEHIALSEALRHLSPLKRSIISLRYFSDLTQKETADALGLTQVKVSREEKKILSELKGILGDVH